MANLYIYASDFVWDTAIAVAPRRLTPRCYFYADGIREARETFARIEAARWPHGRLDGVGAAGIYRASARELARTPSPQEYLPDVSQYVR